MKNKFDLKSKEKKQKTTKTEVNTPVQVQNINH